MQFISLSEAILYTFLSMVDFFALNDVMHVRALRHINDDVA